MTKLSSIFFHEPVEQPKKSKAPKQADTDATLFARFLDGDDAAFMELFDRHTHRLYLYCLKFVCDRQVAEDIMQDLWERVIKYRSRGKEIPPNPLALLHRIARNLCLNNLRDRRNHASIEGLPEWEHPSATPREMSHHEELVIKALPHLPIAQREVLILNAYSGYRFDEIAEMLGEPVGAVRTRAWRARAELGRIMAALIGFDEGNDEDNATQRGDNSRTEEEE